MGNQQSGDTAPQSVSTASSEPLPRLLGHTGPARDVESAKSKPADIEVELPDVPDADDAMDCQDLLGPHLFTMSVPFLLVLSVSALVRVPEKWEISFVSLICSSLVAGFAGAHLFNRASTSNSRSTAGFLFCTWLVGLFETAEHYLLTKGIEEMDTSFVGVLLILSAPLAAVQTCWILYLPLERLESLQTTAGCQLIPVPNMKRRVLQFCAVYAFLNTIALVISLMTLLKTLVARDASTAVDSMGNWLLVIQVLSAITIFGIIWFYCKILSACNHVYNHLRTTRHLVELSGGTAKSQAAFRTAQKAILTESWGLRLVFMATVLVGRPLAFFVKASNPLRFLAQSTLLLCNTAGAWILSNAHGMSHLQGCVITFLMAILVGLVLAGIKISGWELALGILCTALLAAILGLLSGGYFKEGELEAKLIGLCSVDSDCKESMETEWRKKVTELSRRGITAQGLLDFYKKLGKSLMPHYNGSMHTTNDVVRQAIIPATREQRCAYALMAGGPVKPDRMVTHSWQNKFRDLVAAVIADAVHENSFDLIARVLDSDVSVLETMLENLGTGSRAYWICAFSVNQHAGICGGNPNGDCDSVTGKVHETCSCNLPKMFNATPPLSDGRSIGCEMNKFDDMMALLAAGNPQFAQIVAVDQAFGLFTRAWCVAELVQADETHLKQHVKMHSRPLLVMKKETMKNLKVENMQASRPEDVDYILSRIPNKNVFNQKLQKLIFDKAGLLSTWFQLDAARQMEEVGNLLKWSLADDGRGEIWQFWSKWGKAGRAKGDVPPRI
mmetsp:Transcript_24519/g.40026  ORF Transcript_24519/g.40026 Transcript_24519/m.40026 type:complete len:786 (-) Transcript_24519:392-2749(-)